MFCAAHCRMDAADINDHPDFTKDDLVSKDDPYPQFHHWFKQAVESGAIPQPSIMALATCTASAIPSVRMVNMMEMEPNGLVFCTDQYSRKGRELEENPNASVVFYWDPQIRVEGKIRKLSNDESIKYFKTEPRPLQVMVTIVGRQSIVIENKVALKKEYEKMQQKYADESVSIPKPSNWMSYIIEPSRFEFLQAHRNCLQDRIVFMRQSDATWTVQQLTP